MRIPLYTLLFCWPFALWASSYLEAIKPVLAERCYACHGALKQKAGLRLDTAANLLAGSKDQVVVRPGQVEGSALLARVTSEDPDERMPPEGNEDGSGSPRTSSLPELSKAVKIVWRDSWPSYLKSLFLKSKQCSHRSNRIGRKPEPRVSCCCGF